MPTASVLFGSSPRTRGTAPSAPSYPGLHRFIPADAGNRFSLMSLAMYSPVHPRGRGEQYHMFRCIWCVHGSSPRTRGTVQGLADIYRTSRFIPADAGNSRNRLSKSGGTTVHPRGRGEQISMNQESVTLTGSSPRTRGTAPVGKTRTSPPRFIPADAGNRQSGRRR